MDRSSRPRISAQGKLQGRPTTYFVNWDSMLSQGQVPITTSISLAGAFLCHPVQRRCAIAFGSICGRVNSGLTWSLNQEILFSGTTEPPRQSFGNPESYGLNDLSMTTRKLPENI